MTPFLDRSGAYGTGQWAVRPKRSWRDLVALLVRRWIWALDQSFKVAIYLFDISGAFDKVDKDILVTYLRNTGVSKVLCDFIEDYLATRSAAVIVQGMASASLGVETHTCQRTVRGTPSWNVFFKSIAHRSWIKHSWAQSSPVTYLRMKISNNRFQTLSLQNSCEICKAMYIHGANKTK